MAPALRPARLGGGQSVRSRSQSMGEETGNFKKLGALAAVVLALSAIGVASASAAQFTASATGSLTGEAWENQVFTFNGGTVSCTDGDMSGKIEKTADTQQHVTVNYSGCSAFGFSTVDISPATYQYTSNGDLHIKNRNNAQETPVIPITITPTLFGSSICTVTISAQTLDQFDGNVNFSNWGIDEVRVDPELHNIKYTSTGGACGSSGENGTLTGAGEFRRVGGGTVRFDA